MEIDSSEAAIETILRSWLADPDLTLFCGDWRHGGLMELIPRGEAALSGPRYAAPFEGLRELRLRGHAHHVHLDLGRLSCVRYIIAPSVCYGFRPSFEVRFSGDGAVHEENFGLGLALSSPYGAGGLRIEPARRYLGRAAEHQAYFPEAVSFRCDHPRIFSEATRPDWTRIASLMADVDAMSESLTALREALAVVAEGVETT